MPCVPPRLIDTSLRGDFPRDRGLYPREHLLEPQSRHLTLLPAPRSRTDCDGYRCVAPLVVVDGHDPPVSRGQGDGANPRRARGKPSAVYGGAAGVVRSPESWLRPEVSAGVRRLLTGEGQLILVYLQRAALELHPGRRERVLPELDHTFAVDRVRYKGTLARRR